MAKFVRRQRKHKVLAREKARENGTHDATEQDSNVQEILPAQVREREERKARLKDELRSQGVKVSSKKAKRFDKYVENKLKKDETRELLAKLAESKIDTSLLSSTKTLGRGRLTKREELGRALKQHNAGIATDDDIKGLLFQERLDVGDEPASSSDSEEQPEIKSQSPITAPAVVATTALTITNSEKVSSAGSGLKRPLQLDDDGRPKLQKRQKRGGVKSKISILQPEEVENSGSDEWSGFSSESDSDDMDQDETSVAGDSKENVSGNESTEEDDDSSNENSSDESGSEESESGSGDDEAEDDEQKSNKKERSSAFKAWAHQQRNEALGYQPMDSESQILHIPKPANFEPRPVEQDPLPMELLPTKNTSRKAYSVTVTRPPDIQAARLQLPVVAEEQRIMEAIHNHDIVVVCGATGSGKTTQVPQFLYEAGYGSPDSPMPGMIGITQPRRVAAVSMSKRVGQELGDHSHRVAYQIRFEGTVDPKTSLKFMTDGVLLREVAQDIALRKYSAIIVDEAHERSVNTDILIGMLSRVVKLRSNMAKEDTTIRPLKLVIMSATLRVEELTENPNLFSTPPPVLQVEGKQFDVTIHWARRTHHDYVEEAYKKICRGHRKLPPGGFLVFLTGQNEIIQLMKRLRTEFTGMDTVTGPKVRIPTSQAPIEAEDIDFGDIDDRGVQDFDDEPPSDEEVDDEDAEFDIPEEETGTGPSRMQVLPLYSLLPTKEQLRVFEPPPDGSRQVIIATNVAETSLTIPGIRYVFDCGRSKERRYDRITGVQTFEIGWISKASAKQRRGRAGRTGPGHWYPLYSSAVYERDFPEFGDPELLRMPIEGVVLQLKAMNLENVVNFPFPTRPSRESLIKAEKLLTYLSAITGEGKATQIGATMSIFPLSPRFARIILVGHLHDCLPYTIALVAGLSAPDFFIPEHEAIPALPADDGESIRTPADIAAENEHANKKRTYNATHKNFCFLDDRSDAIKLLQVVGEFAHEPTEEWSKDHFVRFKILKEIQQLRRQIVDLLKTNIPNFEGLAFQDKLDPPSSKQVTALKQMVAAGFIDQVAIRADKSPNPPEEWRKPRRAIDVSYLPLMPLDVGKSADFTERMVYIHPSSPLAHLSPAECPEYIVYSYLQRGQASGAEGEKKARTRMHALTDITGGQLAALAKGTPLISYGKPIKEVKGSESEDGRVREVWVVPYLRAEGVGGMGWPLPARKVKQRKLAGKGWVVE